MPVGLEDRDSYFNGVQSNIDRFHGMVDLVHYAKDRYMAEMNMTKLHHATSTHAIQALMYSVASQCRSEAQFEDVFTISMEQPFVRYSEAELGEDLAKRC